MYILKIHSVVKTQVTSSKKSQYGHTLSIMVNTTEDRFRTIEGWSVSKYSINASFPSNRVSFNSVTLRQSGKSEVLMR